MQLATNASPSRNIPAGPRIVMLRPKHLSLPKLVRHFGGACADAFGATAKSHRCELRHLVKFLFFVQNSARDKLLYL